MLENHFYVPFVDDFIELKIIELWTILVLFDLSCLCYVNFEIKALLRCFICHTNTQKTACIKHNAILYVHIFSTTNSRIWTSVLTKSERFGLTNYSRRLQMKFWVDLSKVYGQLEPGLLWRTCEKYNAYMVSFECH